MFVVSVVSGVVAEHTLAFIFCQCLCPPPKVIVERFCCESLVQILAITGGSTGSICLWGVCNLTISLAHRTQERILMEIDALVNNCLQTCFG